MRRQLVALGFAALLGQVALLRELGVAFYGSELVLVLAIGVWLLGTGLGAVTGRGAREPQAAAARLLLAAAWLLPAAAVTARVLRRLLGGVPGAYLELPRQLLGLALVLLPAGLVLGRCFRDAAAAYRRRGGSPATAYGWESGGSLVAGIFSAGLLHLGASNLVALLLAAAAAAAGALGTAGRDGKIQWAAATTLALLLAATAGSGRLDVVLTRVEHPDLLAVRDTPYGRVTVTGREGQVAVFWNDALGYESEGTAAEEFVHLAALQAARPDSVLVLGGGVEGLVREVVKHRPRHVEVVELDTRRLDLLLRLLPAADTAPLADPVVRSTIGDPRRRLAGSGRFDLILVGEPQPDSGQTNRYYTREFFRLCREHLRPGGILALRLRAAENLWTPLLVRRNAGVVGALREVFGDVLVLPGTTSVVLASPDSLVRDPAVLAHRFRERGITARLVCPAWLAYELTNDRTATIAGLLHGSDAPVNSDLRPVCYQTSLALWLARFHPTLAMRRWSESFFPLAAALLLLPAWLLLPLRRRRRLPLATIAVASCGLMVLEGTLILLYQTTRGVLYQDLGLLLTAVMAGLTAGAAWAGRATRRAEGRSVRAVAVALAGTGGLASLAAVAGGGGLAVTLLLLGAGGAALGAMFGLLGHRLDDRDRDPTAPLYAADLLGGCLGAVLGSLLLIPGLGLAWAGVWTAALLVPLIVAG